MSEGLAELVGLSRTFAIGMQGMAAPRLHREFHGFLWASAGLFAVAVVLYVVAEARDFPLQGGLVVLAILALLLAIIAEGIHRMNCIELTPDLLRVGRERFRPGDIDALFGVQPPLVLAPEEQRRVEDEFPLPRHADIRIAGGAWGRRIGTKMVVMRDAQTQQLVAVFTRHPRRLDRLLTDWVGQVPDSPPP